MREQLPASYFDLTAIGGSTIFAYFLLFFLGIMIGQDIWQRVFTARTGGIARWGGVAAGVYCLLYAVAGALVGSAARVILLNLATLDNAFAQVTKAALPVGLTGLVLAAALATMMSTTSATLLAASTILANDVYAGFFSRGGNRVLLSRVFTLLVGVVVLVISLSEIDVVGGLTVAYDLLSGALLVSIIGGLFWRRATGAGPWPLWRREESSSWCSCSCRGPLRTAHNLRDSNEPRDLRGGEPTYPPGFRRGGGGLGSPGEWTCVSCAFGARMKETETVDVRASASREAQELVRGPVSLGIVGGEVAGVYPKHSADQSKASGRLTTK